ncbi:MAG: hypothetical protein U0575_10680 [Phycisphaerales bacterium]
MSQSRLLINNTLATLLRMGLTFWLGLATTRLILAALGATDFGIYTVLAGGIGFIALLQPAFINSAQRHMAHEIGRGDQEALRVVFSACVIAFAGVAALLCIVSLALLPAILAIQKIPPERHQAATVVYLCMTSTLTLTALGAPFGALAAAHQRLARITLFQIATSVGNLVAAIIIINSAGDRLMLYGGMVTLVNVGYMLAVMSYALRSFPHVRFSRRGVSWAQIRALGGFAGWILVDSMSWALRLQTSSFLLGVFFAPAIVAGYGVAVNVAAYQVQWASILWAASMPALAAMHGAGRVDRMADLAVKISKMNGLLAQWFFVPIVLEMPTLLRAWLRSPPAEAPTFAVLVASSMILPPLASGIGMAMYAADRGRPVAVISLVTSIVPLTLAAIIFATQPGAPPWVLAALMLVATTCSLPVIVLLLGPRAGVSPRRFMREVVPPYVWVVAIELAATLPIRLLMNESLLRAGLVLAVFIAVGAVAIWFFGLDDGDRVRFLNALPSRLRRRIAREEDPITPAGSEE